MFYKLDSTRFSFREYWWGNRSPLVLFKWLAKILRIRLPSSVDDPNVDLLEPFEVSRSELPEEFQEKLDPVEAELAGCGFYSPLYHHLVDRHHSTRHDLATLCHESGQAFVRVQRRVWSFFHPPKEYFFPTFVTEFDDGSYVVSTAGKADMLAPSAFRINRIVGAPARELWKSHQELLDRETSGKSVVPVYGGDDLRDAVERHQSALCDFHVGRGVFVPMSEQEIVRAAGTSEAAHPLEVDAAGAAITLFDVAGSAETDGAASAVDPAHAEVLEQIDRLHSKKPGWGNFVLILVVSMLLFVGAGAAWWDWKITLLLIPILLFHELGHYAAMLAFKYRNLRMFFIPFFGAAVSGRNYNVAGWKKAIVSLMGPVPGIGLGVVLGILAVVFEQKLLLDAALLMLVLNGLNLLPVLPLDGGWLAHTLLFSRHVLLDIGFRVLTALALLVGGLATGDRILMFISIPMVIGIPAAFRMSRIAARLRRRGLPSASIDNETIPAETAGAIIDEIKRVFPSGLNNKAIAQWTLHVFEAMNARPPGWLATMALGGVHVTSLFVAVVAAVTFVVARHADLGDFLAEAVAAPEGRYQCGSIQEWSGGETPGPGTATDTIVAGFPTVKAAGSTFQRISERLPANARVKLFGQHVLLSLPRDDEAGRDKWFKDLESRGGDVFVASEDFQARLTLVCIAPTEATAQELEESASLYFHVPSNAFLIPPWSSERSVTPEQVEARRTYRQLIEADSRRYEDQRLARLLDRMAAARRKGDRREIARLERELNELHDELAEEVLEEFRGRGEQEIDPAIVELYAQSPEQDDLEEPDAAAFEEWYLKLGARMGQIPLGQGLPHPGAGRYCSSTGYVERTGRILRFDWLFFSSVADGVPAFAGWLCDHDCIDFKYNLEAGQFGGPFDADETRATDEQEIGEETPQEAAQPGEEPDNEEDESVEPDERGAARIDEENSD